VAYRRGPELVLMKTESGTVARRFRLPAGNGFLAGWSPDGKQLGFGGWNPDDSMPCVILSVDTGKAVQVAPRYLTLPAWSPDGTQITFDLRLKTGTEIWLLEAAALKTLPTFQLPELSTDEGTK